MTRCNGRHSQTPQLKSFQLEMKNLWVEILTKIFRAENIYLADVVLVLCVEQIKKGICYVICACWMVWYSGTTSMLCALILFWLYYRIHSQLRGEKIPAPNLKLPGISDFYFQADMKFLPNYLDLNQLRLGEYIDHLLI